MSDLQQRLNTALKGRYVVGDELGTGGTAIVYAARDLRHERRVAIKVLRPDIGRVLGADRFLEEIRTTARLAHPHILPLLDSGNAKGHLFYVMPYVGGSALRRRMGREEPVPLNEAMGIVRDVADALAYAHEQGVIHRDIKPENVLLESGHALVTDFGIARALSTARRPNATDPNAIIGTPMYMSPEQVEGDTELDGRSDVYALGCVLFEMLTGTTPFSGGARAVMLRRLVDDPPVPSSLVAGIPAWADALVAGMLQRDRAERMTAADVLGAMRDPVRVHPPEERSIAVLPFANMSGDPADDGFADGITDEIINALSLLPGVRVVARTSAFAFKGRNEDLRNVGRRLHVTKVLEGSVRRAGERLRIMVQLINVADGYHIWSKRYDRDLHDVFAIQDEIAAEVAGHFQVTMALPDEAAARAPTRNLEAFEYCLAGRALLAERGVRILEGLRYLERAVALDPEYALAQAGLAEGYALIGLYGLAPPAVMGRSRAAVEKALEIDPDLADAHAALGFLKLISEWDWDGSEEAFRRALSINPNAVEARSWYGMFLATARHAFDEAIGEVTRAVQLDPLGTYPLGYLGVICLGARKYDEALRVMEPAGARARSFLFTWMLGTLQDVTGRKEEALDTLRAALAMSGRHPFALASLGMALGSAGRPEETAVILEELAVRARREYVPSTVFAGLHSALGQVDDAVSWIRRAYEERSPGLPSVLMWPYYDPIRSHPDVVEIQRNMLQGDVAASIA